jgi:hypothetical protein
MGYNEMIKYVAKIGAIFPQQRRVHPKVNDYHQFLSI